MTESPEKRIVSISILTERGDGSTVVYTLNPEDTAVQITRDLGFWNRYDGGFELHENDPFGWPSDKREPTHIRYSCVFPNVEEQTLEVERRWASTEDAAHRISSLEAQLAASEARLAEIRGLLDR